MSKETIIDFGISGPRSANWCIKFIDRRGGGAGDHHRFFKSIYRLQKGDWGVDTHELIMRSLEHLGCFDGADLSNLLGVEDLFRQAQLIEYVYMQENDTSGKAKGKGSRLVAAEEAAVFTGTHRDSGEAMVFPELLDFVSKEIERDASIMKQIRKAREEREILHKKKKKGSGKEGDEQ